MASMMVNAAVLGVERKSARCRWHVGLESRVAVVEGARAAEGARDAGLKARATEGLDADCDLVK